MVELITRRHSAESPWTYAQLDELQRQVAGRVRAGGPGALILSEVAPVITHGRRTQSSDILLGGAPLYPVNRGGLATYHGPGQWVAFAVDRLDRLTGDPRGVRKMVCALLAAAADVGRLYRDPVRIGEGAELGAWSDSGKFAAVGIHVAQGVVQHGLSLNGFRTPESFQGLRPCGLDKPVDYLLAEADLPAFAVLGEQLKEALLRHLWQEAAEAHSDAKATVPTALPG